MKLTVSAKSKALAFVSPVARGNSLPVLNHIRLAIVEGGIAEYQADDLDVRLTVRESIDVPEPAGACLISEKSLAGLAKVGGVVDSNCTTARLETLSGVSTVNTLPVEDWPVCPKFETKSSVTIDAEEMHVALRSLAKAQSRDATRFVLNGILVEFNDDEAVFVATDGKRLHKYVAGVTVRKAGSILIPSATVKQLMRLPKTGTVAFEAGDDKGGAGRFRAVCGNYTVEGRQIQGNFPNWRQVMRKPDEMPLRYSIGSEAFKAGLAGVKHVQTEKNNSVRLGFFTGPVMEIKARDAEGNEAKASVTVERTGEDKDQAVAFNRDYLGDILDSIPGESAVWHFTDELTPCLVTSGRFTAVLMPMRMS